LLINFIYAYLKLSHYTPLRLLGEREYSSYSFSAAALDGGEWSESLPGRALPPGTGPGVPIVQEFGLALEPVWTQTLQAKSFRLCRGSNLDRPYRRLIIIASSNRLCSQTLNIQNCARARTRLCYFRKNEVRETELLFSVFKSRIFEEKFTSRICTVRSFIFCTHPLILIGRSYQEE
jgi:hypothetical protein